MILTDGTATADIGYAQYPAVKNSEMVQATDRSASGIRHTEDFSVLIGTTTYNFEDMSVAEYTTLLLFFLNNAEGQLNSFILTDDTGENSTVKFTTSQLTFNETYKDLWAGSFTVETVT